MVDHTLLRAPASLDEPNRELSREEIWRDFQICCISREASILARREVLTGKAKFGITGDGKEVPQVAMARAFRKGDFRSGYYRDQTFMFALGLSTIEDYFAQLYSDPKNDPFSGGRQMNSHFATPLVDAAGNWVEQKAQYNITSDISSTAGQMARAIGLALASKKYRENEQLQDSSLSNQGREVVFCTIGDASTSEGVFWESMNAAGVMQIPLATFVWDDGYGISVPVKYQTTKASISEALIGLEGEPGDGLRIYRERGWDYASLVDCFRQGIEEMRETHQPALFHITELTQPQGHSTSGSHERYKSQERLAWEREYDCLKQMGDWMIREGMATEEDITKVRKEAKAYVKACRDRAWQAFNTPTKPLLKELKAIYQELEASSSPTIKEGARDLKAQTHPLVAEISKNARRLYFELQTTQHPLAGRVKALIDQIYQDAEVSYHRFLYSESARSALKQVAVSAEYTDASPLVNGYEILNQFFETQLTKYPHLYAFGEDLGQIGGVNQGFAGLQEKFGESRLFDTGIREWTIMGQAIGMAMRGLRPIGEIQYLDYLIYGLEPLTDDLATLRWRSNNLQAAPAIIRTRGHRLEGIWHAGSPLGMIINSLRGVYVCVPRNMVQAAGMYNTLLKSDDPGLVIECLNGYRLKERVPDNLGAFTVPLGQVETLRKGDAATLVTYGSCVRVAQAACKLLSTYGIEVELIDAQTLLPFDLDHEIVDSVARTNRLVILDEDVPGGASAYILQQILETQNAYRHLDSAPVTITAQAHRPPYGSDGDYFSKPNPEDVFEAIYALLHESAPNEYPAL